MPPVMNATDGNVDIELHLSSEVACNNNGRCESDLRENAGNCPLDCSNTPSTSSPISSFPAQRANLPLIYNLKVENITLASAEISWKTDAISRCEVSFGQRPEYEGGTVAETDLAQAHKTQLNNLLSGTLYHFKIACFNISQKKSETGDQQFMTLMPPDTEAPTNVNNFQATAGTGDIRLDWNNPKDDFAGVIIVRREDFYASDPRQGKIIYDGQQEAFIDVDVVPGKRYYYTAFTYDGSGNFSSGAIATAAIAEPGKAVPEIKIPEVAAPPEVEKINLGRFDFIQGGQKLAVSQGKVSVSRAQALTVSIPYEDVPEVLKTIMVTLKQEDKLFSFLLRANKDKTAYEATLVPPDSGIYPLTITILDYKNQAFKKLEGELIVKAVEAVKTQIVQYTIIKKLPPIFYILLGIMVLFIAGMMYRSVKKKKREDTNHKPQITNNFQ